MDPLQYIIESSLLVGRYGPAVNSFLVGYTANKLTDEERAKAIEVAREVYAAREEGK